MNALSQDSVMGTAKTEDYHRVYLYSALQTSQVRLLPARMSLTEDFVACMRHRPSEMATPTCEVESSEKIILHTP